MKTLTTILAIILLTTLNGFTQTPEDLFNQSLTELDNKNYNKAIEIMDEFISKYPDFKNIHMIYLNRASAKSLKKDYEGAIKDYNIAYAKDTTYAEAIRQRGYTKKQMGDLKGALDDYNLALKINPKLANAYVNKAVVLKELGQTNDACKNYEKALELGVTEVVGTLYKSCDSTSTVIKKYTYQILVDKSIDETYGYKVENPIKVGHGPRGQTAYLNLLRDGQGNKVRYERIGSAGFYPSENGMMGMAAVDSYHITYKDEKGKKKKITLYLSFYDYEQPKIPVGLYSIQDFENKK